MTVVCPTPSNPSNPAFESPLPTERLRRFPYTDLIELVLSRISESFKEDWPGTHVCFAPARPWKNWYSKLAGFEQVGYSKRPPGADLPVDRSNGCPREVPDIDNGAVLFGLRVRGYFYFVGRLRRGYFAFECCRPF